MSRGAAGRAGPVTQGYGGPPQIVVLAIREGIRIRVGQSGTKRRLRELQPIIVWAKLVEVNNVAPQKNIEGSVTVGIDNDRKFVTTMVEHVSSRASKVIEGLKITIKRLR